MVRAAFADHLLDEKVDLFPDALYGLGPHQWVELDAVPACAGRGSLTP